MELSFYPKLNETQKAYADRIAAKARQMGIPPELAVAVAFKESSLNPNAPAGSAGEVGIMQIKPATAKDMGFTADQIRDPEKNIEAGLKYLKKSLDMSSGDTRLAAAGYNAGINHPFFSPSGDKLPDTTVNYLKDLKSFGAFTAAPPAEAPAKAAIEFDPAQATVDPALNEVDKQFERIARERGGAPGAYAGAAFAAGRAGVPMVRKAGQFLGGAMEEGRLATQAKAGVPPGATPPVGGGMAANLAGESTAANRILQGTIDPESGASGRARMGGFNIETAQQAARAKQQAQNIGALQRAGAVAQSAPEVLAGAPGMTSSQSGVLYPRTAPATKMTPTPPRGGLDEVTRLFREMIEPGSKTRMFGSAAMRYGLPPLAGYQAGSEIGAMSEELGKKEPSVGELITSGAGATGALMSMFPATAAVGVPLAVTAPLMRGAMEIGKTRPMGQMGDVTAP